VQVILGATTFHLLKGQYPIAVVISSEKRFLDCRHCCVDLGPTTHEQASSESTSRNHFRVRLWLGVGRVSHAFCRM
jgi:hypothetical protein